MESHGISYQDNEGWMYQCVQFGKSAGVKEGFYYPNNLFGNDIEGKTKEGYPLYRMIRFML